MNLLIPYKFFHEIINILKVANFYEVFESVNHLTCYLKGCNNISYFGTAE